MYTTAMFTRAKAARYQVLALCAMLGAWPAIAVRQPLAPAGVEVDLASAPEGYQARVEQAAAESLRLYGDWLGVGLPRLRFAATGEASSAAPGVIDFALPWRSPGPAMEVEAHVAYEIARQYWTEARDRPEIARGLAWYLQSRTVEYLFNLLYASPGYSTEVVRFFGNSVPWAIPSLRVSRWQAVTGTAGARHLPAQVDSGVLRVATAFASLERLLSWPVLQGALAVLAAHPTVPLTPGHVSQTMGAAAGRDLTWFVAEALDSTQRIDYRLDDLASAPDSGACPSPCYRTRVTVRRLGNGVFSGTSRAPLGPFEAGHGIELRVVFADERSVVAHWDGRDPERLFEFHSAAPAAVAQLDPDGVLLLDPTPLDHTLRSDPGTNVPVAKWLVRWGTWLQHAMLTYAMLI